MKNKTTLYHFVIDQSGSMAGMAALAIGGFNTQLQTIQTLQQEKPDEQFLCSLSLFNGSVVDLVSQVPVENMLALSDGYFRPSGSTALLDAIGKSIFNIKERFGTDITEDKMSVVMVIITDGHENSSRMYTYHDIAQLIKSLDETGKWTFSFLGADFDAIHTSQMLNIRSENAMSYNKSSYSEMMYDLSDSIKAYSHSKSGGKLKKDLLDIFKNKDRREAK
jgi:hypothetical protein